MLPKRPQPVSGRVLLLLAMAIAVAALISGVEPAQAAFPGVNGKIAFSSDRDGDFDIHVMNDDGSAQTNLTNDAAGDFSPAWSPDGSKIAFSSTRDGNAEIYVMNADGSAQANLTNDPARDTRPAWSPDGSEIVFQSSFRESNPENAEIYVMNADGSAQTNLTNHPGRDEGPAWSPDGAKIAFWNNRDGGFDIYVMNVDGSDQTRLTNHPATDVEPNWSPDGSKLAFFSARDANAEIYVVDAGGSAQTRLTNTPFNDQHPAWSPDGLKIAYYSPREDGREIFVMNADGSDQTQLTSNLAEDLDPDWQPLAPRVIALAAGGFHTCAVTAGSSVKCWGSNDFGQLGDGTTVSRSTPVDVCASGATAPCTEANNNTLTGVTAVAAGFNHTCALTTAGGAKCWGNNESGGLGDGTEDGFPPLDTEPHPTPVDVIGLGSGVVALAAGGFHTCALTTAGAVQCWGNNEFGRLGCDPNACGANNPPQVSALAGGVTAIAAGFEHTCARMEAGGVKCWGRNQWGTLGNGMVSGGPNPAPVEVCADATCASALSDAVGIAAGGTHTCASTAAAGVKCWGQNSAGEIGDGTGTQRNAPVDVCGDAACASALSQVAAVSAGTAVTCALTTARGVKCWGSNSSGQLGDGTTTARPAPADVLQEPDGEPLIGAADVAVGDNHACALSTTGGVKCWGRNNFGQLGDGTKVSSAIATAVVGLTGDETTVAGEVVALAAGGGYTCALTTGGSVKCWGFNRNGELGNGTTDNSRTPVDVLEEPAGAPLSGVIAIAAGEAHICALTTAGGVKCWGLNQIGQLGAVTGERCTLVACSSTPLDVVGLTGAPGEPRVIAIAAGDSYTCAVTVVGGVKCWGDNGSGQLGDGTRSTRRTPVDVCERFDPGAGECEVALASVVAVAAVLANSGTGRSHTCSLTTAGGVMCWGDNRSGQLGDGTSGFLIKATPVDVVGLTGAQREPRVIAIGVGFGRSCALTLAGRVKCWGAGGLGDGTTVDRSTPVDVCMSGQWNTIQSACVDSGFDPPRRTPLSEVNDIAAGPGHACAMMAGGRLKCWGANGIGQLGDGTSNNFRNNPVDVCASGATAPCTEANNNLLSSVAAVSAGSQHTCAATTAAGVKCWGNNNFGQLGAETTELCQVGQVARACSTTPVDVVGLGPDTDGDGLGDSFEESFGGQGIAISNSDSEPPNTASSTGTAGSGAAITTGQLSVIFPPGTTAETPATEITVAFVADAAGPGVNPRAAISGVSLPAGTNKTVEMPFGDQNALCIDDTASADIETAGAGTCSPPRIEIGIPADGNSNTSGQYTVSRVGSTITVEGLLHTAIATISDTDLDTVQDADDACPTTPGLAERQGCPVGDENTVDLHVVDQAKTGVCPGGAGSCKSPIEGADVRVFDRNDADFQAEYGAKNPSGAVYGQVFENDIGRVGACTTDAGGECTAGEEAIGDYLVIVKYVDAETGKTVYTGKPKSPGDFVDTDADTQGDLASKDFQVVKVLRKNGTIQFSGGSKTVVTGSYLEVISPDFAVWEDVAAGYVYPFIFISESDWDVDLCTRVPHGYAIVGVYDENGDLLNDSRCTQTFVSGETKVIAYEVVDAGSPEPRLTSRLTVTHQGRVTPLTLDVPGIRIAEERAPRGPFGLGATGLGLVPLLMGSALLGVWRLRR